jgi:mono/diheme cytochrome c family protein
MSPLAHATWQRCRSLFAAAALAVGLLAATSSPVAAQGAPQVRSVFDGVYTEAQAEAGEVMFVNVCSACHNAENPLAGHSFLAKWSGRPLYAIWDYLTTRMPYGNPGSLTPEQYAETLAYILRENAYPPGTTPLPSVGYEVANIDFDLAPTR